MLKQYEKALNYLTNPPKYDYQVDLPSNLQDFVSFFLNFLGALI